MAPEVKDQKTRKKIAELENYQNEPVGIGGRPPTFIWITDIAHVVGVLSRYMLTRGKDI
jgi:hypothetical protein